MITIQAIRDTASIEYEYIEQLLTDAFPPEEHRDLEDQKGMTQKESIFNACVIKEDDRFIGILTYWMFDNFVYIEHFATDSQVRNGGYGSKILSLFISSLSLPLVLEVELPTNELAKRRIHFYERLGLHLIPTDYQQPPYRTGDQMLPMHLMSNGEINDEHAVQKIKEVLYSKVYQTAFYGSVEKPGCSIGS